MSIDPAIFRALVAQGASPEMLLAVVEADAAVREERLAKKRANNVERQQRFRDKQRAGRNTDNALQGVTERDTPSFEVPPQTPPPNTNPEKSPPISPRAGGKGKTRLPEDWEVPAVSDLPPKARACAEQWTAASYETHGEAFTSYWHGNGKMMADWRGTWANRVIALHSQVLRDQKFGNAPTANGTHAKPADPAAFEALCDREIERLRAQGNEREALNWERKKRGEAPREGSTGPPRTPSQILLLEQARSYGGAH